MALGQQHVQRCDTCLKRGTRYFRRSEALEHFFGRPGSATSSIFSHVTHLFYLELAEADIVLIGLPRMKTRLGKTFKNTSTFSIKSRICPELYITLPLTRGSFVPKGYSSYETLSTKTLWHQKHGSKSGGRASSKTKEFAIDSIWNL